MLLLFVRFFLVFGFSDSHPARFTAGVKVIGPERVAADAITEPLPLLARPRGAAEI